MSTALSQVAELGAAITEATSEVTVQVDADTAPAEAQIDSVEAVPVEVPVDADTSVAEAEIQSLDAEPIEVQVDADTSGAEAQVDGLTDSLNEAGSAGESASGGLLDAAAAGGILSTAQSGASASSAGLTSSLLGTESATATAALGYGALAAGIGLSINAYGEAQAVAAQTDLIIANTGGNANVTADEVASLATEIQGYSGQSDEAIASGANFALSLAEVRNEAGEGNDVFDRLIRISADYAAATGGEVTSATQRFGRALNDPVRGINLLRRSGVTFTASQQELVASLVESGDILGAQTVLLDSLEGRYAGAARTFGETVPGSLARLQESVGEVSEDLGGTFAPAVELAADAANAAIPVIGGLADALDRAGISALSFVPVAGPVELFTSAIGANTEVVNEGEIAILESQKTIGDALTVVAQAQDAAADAAGETGRSMAEEAADTKGLTDDITVLSGALDELTGAQQSVDEGAIAVRDQQRSLVEALVELNGQYVAGSASGDRFLSAAQSLATGIRDQTVAVLESGAGADAARLAQAGYIDGLRRTLAQAGLTEAQIDDLVETFATVPEEQITTFETPGSQQAINQANLVKQAIIEIPNKKVVTIQIGSNAGAVIGDIVSLDDHIRSLPKVPILEAAVAPVVASGGGGDVIDSSVINLNVDARGATDPQGVAEAIAVALAPHRRVTQIKLQGRARVPA